MAGPNSRTAQPPRWAQGGSLAHRFVPRAQRSQVPRAPTPGGQRSGVQLCQVRWAAALAINKELLHAACERAALGRVRGGKVDHVAARKRGAITNRGA